MEQQEQRYALFVLLVHTRQAQVAQHAQTALLESTTGAQEALLQPFVQIAQLDPIVQLEVAPLVLFVLQVIMQQVLETLLVHHVLLVLIMDQQEAQLVCLVQLVCMEQQRD
jgi:hypothetical protein